MGYSDKLREDGQANHGEHEPDEQGNVLLRDGHIHGFADKEWLYNSQPRGNDDECDNERQRGPVGPEQLDDARKAHGVCAELIDVVGILGGGKHRWMHSDAPLPN